MNELVLIVEDDVDIAEILRLYLESSGFEILSARNGRDGLALLHEHEVSCVILDLMMPVMNGFDFVKEMRMFCDAPVIVLSARTQSADKMLSLDLGADSYLTKPFDSMEVIAYVKAAVRRYRTMGHPRSSIPEGGRSPVLHVGAFELNLEELALRKHGEVIPLTAFEFKILAKLMASPGRVFTKAQLYEAAMGESYEGIQDTVMVHISNIRAKIEDDPAHPSAIVTVRGLGYRFEAS
jgi:DNA-binding response OmpR family regulator